MERRTVMLISGKDPIASTGGHESYVRAHALAAQRAGFEPHVFCVGRRGESISAAFGTVHRVAPPGALRVPVWLQGPMLARAVVAYLERTAATPPHLIHGFAIWSSAATAAARALRRRGAPAAALASAYGTRAYEVAAMQRALGRHLPLARRAYYRAWLRWIEAVDDRIERRGYADADLVLVNYESVREILTHAYGDSIQMQRVPYAPASAFAGRSPAATPSLPPGDAPLIVAVSRHDPRKGIDVLLGALGRLNADGVEFRACLVGPGALLTSHRRIAAALGLNGRVEVTGRVDDVEPYLAAADVYVLPSRAEASGSVALQEALRAGLPIVASACDGIPEDLQHGRDALLIPPGDPRALALTLERVLGDLDLRAALSASARATYERRFSADRFTGALAGVYSTAIEGRHRR